MPESESPRPHPTAGAPAAGLDAERHRRSQAAAKDAEVLRLAVVPGLVAAAVGLEKHISTPGLAAYVDQIAAPLPCDGVLLLRQRLPLGRF